MRIWAPKLPFMINETNMKTILITGSHGYIGSVICPELKKFGYTIKGVDNGYFLDCLLNGSVNEIQFIKKHLNEIIKEDLENINTVIHLAGLQNDPMKSTLPGKVYDIEYEYTKKLADICREHGVRFIYASSCSVYGAGSGELLHEDSPVNPQTPYSMNKLRVEEYLISISGNGFSPVMLRFATVFGYSPRMRFDLYINQFVAMALTEKKIQLNSNGMAWRPNLYIGDIPGVLDAAIKHKFDAPAIINVGNKDSNLQVVNVVEIIKNILPGISTSLLNFDDKTIYCDQYVSGKKDNRSYQVNFTKMTNLPWENMCPTSVIDGIEILVRQLKKEDDLHRKMKDPRFFRLQWTRKLISRKDIDKQFQWSN